MRLNNKGRLVAALTSPLTAMGRAGVSVVRNITKKRLNTGKNIGLFEDARAWKNASMASILTASAIAASPLAGISMASAAVFGAGSFALGAVLESFSPDKKTKPIEPKTKPIEPKTKPVEPKTKPVELEKESIEQKSVISNILWAPKRNDDGSLKTDKNYRKEMEKTLNVAARTACQITALSTSPAAAMHTAFWGRAEDIDLARMKQDLGDEIAVEEVSNPINLQDYAGREINLAPRTVKLKLQRYDLSRDAQLSFYENKDLHILADHAKKHSDITDKQYDVVKHLINHIDPDHDSYLHEVGMVNDIHKMLILFLQQKVFKGESHYFDRDIAQSLKPADHNQYYNDLVDNKKEFPSERAPAFYSLSNAINAYNEIDGLLVKDGKTDADHLFGILERYHSILSDNRTQKAYDDYYALKSSRKKTRAERREAAEAIKKEYFDSITENHDKNIFPKLGQVLETINFNYPDSLLAPAADGPFFDVSSFGRNALIITLEEGMKIKRSVLAGVRSMKVSF